MGNLSRLATLSHTNTNTHKDQSKIFAFNPEDEGEISHLLTGAWHYDLAVLVGITVITVFPHAGKEMALPDSGLKVSVTSQVCVGTRTLHQLLLQTC